MFNRFDDYPLEPEFRRSLAQQQEAETAGDRAYYARVLASLADRIADQKTRPDDVDLWRNAASAWSEVARAWEAEETGTPSTDLAIDGVIPLRYNTRGPETVRAAKRDGCYTVDTYNARLESWVTQAEHGSQEAAIADAEGWY